MTIEPTRDGYRIESRLWLPQPLAEVWPFFADPTNLEHLTPGFLRFAILTPQPIEMGVGTRIDYRLRLHGLPVRWQTEIVEWDPPHGFVDSQRRGPYQRWLHRHRFEARDGGTECLDQVDYRLPLGWAGRLAHALWVRRDVAAIFAYRSAALDRLFPSGGGRLPDAARAQ
jgi:ligand-binding SRPBCC domain-containing protein